MQKNNIYIEPEELKNYRYFNIKKGQELFNIGYEVAVIALSS